MEPSATSASIRKGDQVRVMSGRDRGKVGRVLSVNPEKRTVTVEHAHIIKRHTRANPSKKIERKRMLNWPKSMSCSFAPP